jgi:DNA polymerase III epsilon subunit-like protein
MHLLYVDTETTGLNPDTCRIVQLAARLTIAGRVIDLNTYIQPDGFTIPDAAYQIHGIDAHFAQTNGIPLVDALTALEALIIASDAIVGHHISFDVSFLAAEARRAGLIDLATAINAKTTICTKKMSAKYLTDHGEIATRSTTKLTTMFERFTNQSLTGAHDAFTDVLACELIFSRMN